MKSEIERSSESEAKLKELLNDFILARNNKEDAVIFNERLNKYIKLLQESSFKPIATKLS